MADVTLLSNEQAAALCAVLGSMGTACGFMLRWAIDRITKAIEDSTEARLEDAKATATQAAKLDELTDRVEAVHGFVARTSSPALAATAAGPNGRR